MRVVAAVLSAWVAGRWVGFVVGLTRIGRFDGPVRREARRAVITRGALNVSLSIGVVYLWSFALRLDLAETFVGFLAACMTISLAAGAAARLMQPSARIPHTVAICHLVGATPDTPVRPVGRVMGTDASGAYVPELVSRVDPPWDAAVSAYVDALIQRFANAVNSIYVRGSLAKGTAIEGVSDLDGIAVVDSQAPVDREWLSSLHRDIRARFPFVEGLEVIVWSHGELFADEGHNYRAFLLATQAVCVHGPSVIDDLPRFGFGPWAFSYAQRLDADIDTFLASVRTEPDAERRRSCVWIMRRIVRSGFEVVMDEEGTFTRDLFPCYEAFRRHHPEHADELWRALELAVSPTDDVDAAARVCEGIGRWVAGMGAEAYRRAEAAVSSDRTD